METTKTDNKYSTGKIYTIRSFQTDKIYIGSTRQPLHKRLHGHRLNYKSKSIYVTSYEIIKYDDHYIELLEDYPCETKNQLNRREGELIRLHKEMCVNICIAGRTKEEYHVDHRDVIIAKVRKYYADNTEHVKEIAKERYIENRDKYLEKADNYRELKRETINSNRRIKVICECGLELNKYGKKQHEQSIRHQNYINNVVPDIIPEKTICECGSSHNSTTKARNGHSKSKKHQEYLLTLLI